MKNFIFRIPAGKIEMVVDNKGEIIKIDSSSNEYGKKHLEKTLDVAVKADLDMFLRLRGALVLNSKHYKLVQQALKRRKNQLEEDIKKISKIIPE